MSFEHMTAAEGPEVDSARPTRKLTDPKAMRAVAHPTRLALLEALAAREPLTATEASTLVGESPTNCAFHLRTLAKYGFVEEAGGGVGRSRPWRRAHVGFTLEQAADTDDETTIAAGNLSAVLWDIWIERIRRIGALQSTFPKEWHPYTRASETVLYLTSEEATEFHEELSAMLLRYRERLEDSSLRPDRSIPMEMVQFAFPLDALHPIED